MHCENNSQMLPVRKTPRLSLCTYSDGDFFVTICTQDREHFFGYIHDDEMYFSEIGSVANKLLEELPTHHKYVSVVSHVVMPNHIHAIIRLSPWRSENGGVPQTRTPLSAVIGNYKQSVTMYARRHKIPFAWQPRYHDHVIRGEQDGNNIVDYIANNPKLWHEDCYNQ